MTCSVTSNSNSAERSFLTSDRVSRAKREVLEVARTLGAQKGSCAFIASNPRWMLVSTRVSSVRFDCFRRSPYRKWLGVGIPVPLVSVIAVGVRPRPFRPWTRRFIQGHHEDTRSVTATVAQQTVLLTSFNKMEIPA